MCVCEVEVVVGRRGVGARPAAVRAYEMIRCGPAGRAGIS